MAGAVLTARLRPPAGYCLVKSRDDLSPGFRSKLVVFSAGSPTRGVYIAEVLACGRGVDEVSPGDIVIVQAQRAHAHPQRRRRGLDLIRRPLRPVFQFRHPGLRSLHSISERPLAPLLRYPQFPDAGTYDRGEGYFIRHFDWPLPAIAHRDRVRP